LRAFFRWWLVPVVAASILISATYKATGILAAKQGISHAEWLATSFLRGLYLVGTLLENAWFVGLLVILAIFGPEVRRFLAKVTNVEVSGVKLAAAALSETLPELATLARFDDGAVGPAYADMPGGDGFILEEPKPTVPDYEAYQRCIRELPPLLGRLEMSNQQEIGQQLKKLEWDWAGDYAQELRLSVTLLRRSIDEGRITQLQDVYLATALPLRRMMLYMYGEKEHFDELLAEYRFIGDEHFRGTLCAPYTMRLLIALCERKDFDRARRFAGIVPMFHETCRPVRQAYLAYIDLKTGNFETAFGGAVSALREPVAYDQSKQRAPALSAMLMLRFVAARAALHLGRNLEAIRYAKEALGTHPTKAAFYRDTMHRDARRILAEAYLQLQWHDGLYELYLTDPGAARDPHVLNAVAVLLQSKGRSAEAKAVLKQALALLPKAQGDDDLTKVIKKNSKTMGV
jgi:tetratricopeptide (TPR) repeat protein